MGSVNPRIPKRLILEISRGLDLRHFIETGTHVGTSALWASRHFEKVWTVELDPQLFAQARDLLAGRPNVEQSLGDSAEMLRSLLPRLDRPALFWLDAHWAGEGTAGGDYPCPVLDEIAAFDASAYEHVVMIDDARYILNAEPPFTPGRWPDAGTITAHLRRRRTDDYIAIHSDVLFRIPRRSAEAFQDILRAYAREPDEADEQQHRSLIMRIRDRLQVRTRLRKLLKHLGLRSGA